MSEGIKALEEGRAGARLGVAKVAALAALIAALFAFSPAFLAPADAKAKAHIYWTTRVGDIGRANLDGTGVDRDFISAATVFPSAIALSGRHIYWSDPISYTIGRARLDGTGVDSDFLSFPGSGVFRPHDVVVHGDYVYWANWGPYIGRARLDGTGGRTKFVQVKYFTPGYLAASAHHLYWTGLAYEEPNVVGRANFDGSGVRNNFFQSETSPFYLAAGGGHLYWTTGGFAIARANLDGTGVRAKFIVSDERTPGGIAVGGSRVYWAALSYSAAEPTPDAVQGWIGRREIDGGAVRWIFVGSGEEIPTDVAIGPGARSERSRR